MQRISVLLSAIIIALLVNACNNSATGNTSEDTATKKDSVKPPTVTEGGIKDTTMHGFDSTRSDK